jgi:hypothetical protein
LRASIADSLQPTPNLSAVLASVKMPPRVKLDGDGHGVMNTSAATTTSAMMIMVAI